MSATTTRHLAAANVPGLEAVEHRIHGLLADESARWAIVDPSLAALPQMLDDYVRRGGKRLRPAFLLAGVRAAGAGADPGEVVDVGAALELLHVFALIHDDVMDGSATRRGQPALHVALEAAHGQGGGSGESRRYGEGLAVLAGDLAFVYADHLIPNEHWVRVLWDELRVELTMGQYLDVQGSGFGIGGPSRARQIATLKSGRYTIVRPLHLAATLADRGDLMLPFTRFGEPLGRAFQLRDDVLGAFGEPADTGKPSGDDLREGKPTLLLTLARERATPTQRLALAPVGRGELSDAALAEIREVLVSSGALAAAEREIEQEIATATEALASMVIDEAGRAELERLTRVVVDRVM